jgi:hypothetical protein
LFFNPSTGTLNSTIFNSLSDKKLKENIVLLTNASNDLLKLNGYSFSFKNSGIQSYGVIAQEVEKVLPNAVDTTEEGIKSVNYNALIALLIEDSKQKTKQIEELSKMVAELNNKIKTENR